MLVVTTPVPSVGGLPNTVTGTGTTPKTFNPILNMPGSSRLDGVPATIRASGNISAGVSSTTQFSIFANYPSSQYPVANITNGVGNTTGGANIALYNANNNFVLGQYVTVVNGGGAGMNGTVGPLIVANSTAFAGLVNGANVANAAAVTVVGTATIGPQTLYQGAASPALNVGATSPWMAEVRIIGDSGSGLLTCYGTDQTVNVNLFAVASGLNVYSPSSSTGTVNVIPGVNFKQEPPLYFTAAETFGSSNAANTATLKAFYLES